MSLVEVAPSTLSVLKVRSAASLQDALQLVARHVGVGGEEGEHRRHVGRDHAAALGHAAEREGRALDHRFLGDVIGGEDALGGVVRRRRPTASSPASGVACEDQVHRQRRADDPGRADQHIAPCRCRAPRPRPRSSPRHRPCPAAPVPALALPELTMIAAALPPLAASRARSSITGGATNLFWVKTRDRGHRLAVVGRDQRHVVAAPLDPGMAAGGDEALRRR